LRKHPCLRADSPDPDEQFAQHILGAPIEVHRIFGSGFRDSVYEKTLLPELPTLGREVQPRREIVVPCPEFQVPGRRLHLLAGGRIFVQLNAVEAIAPISQAQLLP